MCLFTFFSGGLLEIERERERDTIDPYVKNTVMFEKENVIS